MAATLLIPALQTVDIFRQHALNVFETYELITARISEYLRAEADPAGSTVFSLHP